MGNGSWKREFNTSFLKIDHHKPYVFVICVWQKKQEVHWAYILFRVFMSVVFITITICSLFDIGRKDPPGFVVKWPIYLTYWGFLLCTMQFVFGAGITVNQFVLERKHGNYAPKRDKLNCWYRIFWVLNTTALVAAVGITMTYWGTEYQPGKDELDVIGVFVHAANTVCMLLDFLLAAHPFRLLHIYLPFLFITTYMLFNLVYFELGGTDRNNRNYIYGLTNWNRPRRTLLTVTLGIIFVLFLHCIMWSLYVLKRWLIGLCLKDKSPLYEDYRSPSKKTILNN